MRSRSARNTPKLYHHAIKADLMDSSSISLSGTDELRTSLGLWPCAIPELIPPYKIPKEFITVEVSCYNISCTPGITGQIIPFWHATRLEVTAFQCSHLWKKCWQIIDDGHWTPANGRLMTNDRCPLSDYSISSAEFITGELERWIYRIVLNKGSCLNKCAPSWHKNIWKWVKNGQKWLKKNLLFLWAHCTHPGVCLCAESIYSTLDGIWRCFTTHLKDGAVRHGVQQWPECGIAASTVVII